MARRNLNVAIEEGRGDRRNARDVDPDLAAMAELYALLACKRNEGARTAHVLPAVGAERRDVVARAIRDEGFAAEMEAREGGTVVTVWRAER